MWWHSSSQLENFITGSMPWPMTHNTSVHIAKCSQCWVRNASDSTGPCSALVPLTRGKGVTIQRAFIFCCEPLKKAVGMSNFLEASDFKHIAVMQPNSCPKLRGLGHSVLFQGIWKFRHLHTSHIRMPQTQEESVQMKTLEHLFVEGHNHSYHMQEWVHQMRITKWIPESAWVKMANIWSHHHPAAVFMCETANLWHLNQYTHNSQQHAIHFLLN